MQNHKIYIGFLDFEIIVLIFAVEENNKPIGNLVFDLLRL